MASRVDRSYLGVNFFGPANQNSGYGNAVRCFSKAFYISGINTSYSFLNASSKKKSFLDKQIESYNGKCNVDFYLHCPGYGKYKNNNYKIGYFYWEADTLPSSWNRAIRTLDEIWAPCDLVKEACLKAGFHGKIEVVPTPIERWTCEREISIPSLGIDSHIVSDDVFKFYSIFQWHHRKGFDVLLKSYLETFSKDDNVILILKCNPLGVKGIGVEQIKSDIIKIKSSVKKTDYPLIYLITKYLDKDYLFALHNYADCFVLPHRGEGWGIPIHNALYAGNNVITTKYGGVTEKLNKGNSHIIPHKLVPVKNMEWCGFYSSHQKWAEPSKKELSNIMSDVYRNYNSYSKKRKKARALGESMDIESVSGIISEIFRKRGFSIAK